MESLKNALSKVLSTTEQVAKAYEDKKVTLKEWFQIGTSALGWVWIFKNLDKIKADVEASTQEGMDAMMEELKVKFDIPQEELEETIEQVLSVVMLILTLVGKKVSLLKVQ